MTDKTCCWSCWRQPSHYSRNVLEMFDTILFFSGGRTLSEITRKNEVTTLEMVGFFCTVAYGENEGDGSQLEFARCSSLRVFASFLLSRFRIYRTCQFLKSNKSWKRPVQSWGNSMRLKTSLKSQLRLVTESLRILFLVPLHGSVNIKCLMISQFYFLLKSYLW